MRSRYNEKYGKKKAITFSYDDGVIQGLLKGY